jgi:nucleotide-binding universal stress UspA family protein
MRVHRILVPVDFSDCSRAAIDWAAELANRFDSQIDVLHVVEAVQFVFTPDVPFALEPALDLEAFESGAGGREMKRILQTLEDAGATARGRLSVGEPGHTILTIAGEEDYDLIVMGTHGRRGVSRLLHGRTAAAVVKSAPCPVLTIRATTAGRARVPQPADAGALP